MKKKLLLMTLVSLVLKMVMYGETVSPPVTPPEITIPGGIVLPEGTVLPPLDEELPLIPFVPISPEELVEENGKRILEKTFTVMLEARVKVFVPLEILSDIDLKAVVIDDQEIDVPFEIEMNREPEQKDYYKLKFSETEIDIDKDGTPDTFIYAPEYINSRIVDESYVKIKGSGIKEEGVYKKKVYITIEVPDGHDSKYY